MPAAELDLQESDQDCFSKSFAWFDNSDPATCSWKTWQRSLLGDWIEFSESWPRSGMTRNGIAYRLRPLVPRISGTGSSSLPPTLQEQPATPSRDWNGGRSSEATQERNSRPLNERIENAAASGQLNPQWVSWLMGFPIDWCDLQGELQQEYQTELTSSDASGMP